MLDDAQSLSKNGQFYIIIFLFNEEYIEAIFYLN